MQHLFTESAMVWLTRWCFVVEKQGLICKARCDIDHDTFRKNYMNVRQIGVFLVHKQDTDDIISFFVLKNGRADDPEVLDLQEKAKPPLEIDYKTGPKILHEQLLPHLAPGQYVGPHCFKQEGEAPIHAFNSDQRTKPRKKQSAPYTAKPCKEKRRKAPTSVDPSPLYASSYFIPIDKMELAVQDFQSKYKSTELPMSHHDPPSSDAVVNPAPDPPPPPLLLMEPLVTSGDDIVSEPSTSSPISSNSQPVEPPDIESLLGALVEDALALDTDGDLLDYDDIGRYFNI